jgi:hypothetical protein
MTVELFELGNQDDTNHSYERRSTEECLETHRNSGAPIPKQQQQFFAACCTAERHHKL